MRAEGIIRRSLTRFRLALGYCRYCENHRNQDAELCDLHLILRDKRPCHCGEPVAYGYNGDATHHRGMCADCDAVRCDAYPMDCPRREEWRA